MELFSDNALEFTLQSFLFATAIFVAYSSMSELSVVNANEFWTRLSLLQHRKCLNEENEIEEFLKIRKENFQLALFKTSLYAAFFMLSIFFGLLGSFVGLGLALFYALALIELDNSRQLVCLFNDHQTQQDLIVARWNLTKTLIASRRQYLKKVQQS